LIKIGDYDPEIHSNHIEEDLFKGKIIHVPGARQVGKTTLMIQITKNFSGEVL
jgi:predicted AAA+ superfamily ATPase